MDHDLDLFDRGDVRFRVPLDIFDLVRLGAEVTGVIAHDQAFGPEGRSRSAARAPGPPLWPAGRVPEFGGEPVALLHT